MTTKHVRYIFDRAKRFRRHIEVQTAQCVEVMDEATRTKQPTPEQNRRLFTSGAPIFTIISLTGLVLAGLSLGPQAAPLWWIWGALAGVVLFLMLVADHASGYRLSCLPSRLPFWLRPPLAILMVFGPIAAAVWLWISGLHGMVASLALGATTALVLSGAASWAWFWWCGAYSVE